jgi:hypothetical protein
MQSLSKIFQCLCFVTNMNINQFWMKNLINPKVFIWFNFFLHLSTHFPNNHHFRRVLVFFIDCQPVDFFDPGIIYSFYDRKCFQSIRRDKVRLRCNTELIIVCMILPFLWSNQFLPASLSTFRPWRFTSPFPFENLLRPFLPDFYIMHPLWIRFP